ncbi:unnamed protein product, partial [Rotaria magnacalcarata]
KEENNAIIIDAEDDAGYIEFERYNELREKRYNLEAEQALYVLEVDRVERELNEQEEIVAPTLTRSLGEDFSLQP